MIVTAASTWFPEGEPTFLALGVEAIAAGAVILLWRAATGSRAALITLLATAAILPCLNFRDREIGAVGLDPQNAVKLATWAATGVVAAVRWRSWTPRLGDPAIRALWVYVLVAAPTILVSPLPVYSAASLFGFAATLAFAACCAAELPERTLANTLLLAVGAYAGLGLLAALVAPDVAFLAAAPGEGAARLRGLASHPNMLAKDVAGLGGAAIVLGLRSSASRRMMTVVGIIGCAAIAMAASRSVIVALVAALALWWWRWSDHRRLAVGLIAGTAAFWMLGEVAGLTPGATTLSSAVSRTGDGADVATLTGRTDLWTYVLGKVGQHPFVGYGFNATEIVIEPGWWGQPEAGIRAHDMYLQSLLTTGILGTLPLLAFLWIVARRAWRERDCACRFVPGFLGVLGLTEAEFATYPLATTLALFLLVAVDSERGASAPEVQAGEGSARSSQATLPRIPASARGSEAIPDSAAPC